MRPAVMAAVIVSSVLAVGGVIWFGRYARLGTAGDGPTQAPVEPPPAPTVVYPKPSPTGPHPRVALESTDHDFGVMQVGSEKSHTFVLRNAGEAPLELVKSVTSCKCTLNLLENQAVPAGGQVEIVLTWKGQTVSPEFSQTATIRTNDPKAQEVVLSIRGRVEEIVNVLPRESWQLGTVSGDEPVTVTGRIFSGLVDSFAVKSIVPGSDRVKTETVPLTAEELAELGAKSGYVVKVSFKPDVPVGPFQESLVIETDLKDAPKFTLPLVGVRGGPLEILPTPGFEYHVQAQALQLPVFEAKDGFRARLLLYVKDAPGIEFRPAEIVRQPDFIQVEFEKDEAYRTRSKSRYFLTFVVPPGAPPAAYKRKDSAKITLKTTHPDIPELKFYLDYVSR